MTNLDRLLELAKEVKYAGLDTVEENQEYQSLYEKLKKAEEFYDSTFKYGSNDARDLCYKLLENQKSQEGIVNRDRIIKLDKELHTRIINYQRLRLPELVENTRSLYYKIFGREI